MELAYVVTCRLQCVLAEVDTEGLYTHIVYVVSLVKNHHTLLLKLT